jgi:enoyl-CoA hydratase/carnithine racemase
VSGSTGARGVSGDATLATAIATTSEEAVGWIRIARPERLNAFADDMRDRLDDALATFEADAGIRCVVIIGTGRAFSTGDNPTSSITLASVSESTPIFG